MFMQKKKRKMPSPVSGVLIALPLLALGILALVKKKGQTAARICKSCADGVSRMMDCAEK